MRGTWAKWLAGIAGGNSPPQMTTFLPREDPSMDERTTPTARQHYDEGQLQAALAHIGKLLVSGLDHGFFEYRVSCRIQGGGKRQILISGGKSHSFTVAAQPRQDP